MLEHLKRHLRKKKDKQQIEIDKIFIRRRKKVIDLAAR